MIRVLIVTHLGSLDPLALSPPRRFHRTVGLAPAAVLFHELRLFCGLRRLTIKPEYPWYPEKNTHPDFRTLMAQPFCWIKQPKPKMPTEEPRLVRQFLWLPLHGPKRRAPATAWLYVDAETQRRARASKNPRELWVEPLSRLETLRPFNGKRTLHVASAVIPRTSA